MDFEEDIIKKYVSGLITKKEAMDTIGLKKAAFNSKMRKYGYSSETHFFPGKENKPLVSKNDKLFWESLHKDYVDGLSITDIANNLGLRTKTIKDRFTHFNLTLKSISEIKKQGIDKLKKYNLDKYGSETPTKNLEIKNKIKNTNMQKYGVDNVSKLDSVKKDISVKVKSSSKDALEKRKLSNKEKYGVYYVSQNDSIKNKIEETNIARYGFKSPASSKEIRNKIKDTNKLRYGGISPLSNQEVIAKRINTVIDIKLSDILNKLNDYGYKLLDNYKGLFKNTSEGKRYERYKIEHLSCSNIFEDDLYLIPRCPKCFPLIGNFRSQLEILINEYVKSIGFETICNSKDIIKNIETGKNFEIDIYIPDKKLALEINSLYHHSSQSLSWGKPLSKNYHANKTKSCSKLGIKLLHIWDDWDLDIIKSMITNELGLSKIKKHARKLDIGNSSTSNFFNSNHVHGSVPCKWEYTLEENKEILCAISFRLCSEGLEIARFATKKGYSVRGGFSRLLKKAIDDLKPEKIISYCDRDLSPIAESTVYYRNGFTLIEDTGPRLFYTNFKKRWSREKFQKHKLMDMYPNSFDINLTANQILEKERIFPFWNSGNWKFVLNLK